ncbi:hypothetical protein [Paracidovorax avenae]|uniref:hypothetical protein n=1 Tax=Paracidovorax avenae TaxID=80867 RepID=UPI000D1764AB|nr:hypothetical protein [Paracidovorax avenae]AVS87228.1 hypothetical protein C8238_02285 [Paracidovorax avenae]AVT01410.1 hypothetical protein C8243_02090 [Paracidovorax avenae]AVT08485.1 hypothetical protein C8242_02455 [Paracidovorax avenae]
MHAPTLTPSLQPSAIPAAWRSGANRLVSCGGRPGVQLRLVSLVEPPLLLDEGFPQASGLWVSSQLRFSCGMNSLALLHMAMHGLLIRLESMAGASHGMAANHTLRMLVEGRLTHVFASTADFQRLTGHADDGTAPLPRLVDIDVEHDWLVVDAQRGFHNARPAPALIAGLVRLAEIPRAARRLDMLPDTGPAGPDGDRLALLLEAARALAQQDLGDRGATLSQDAGTLASRLGVRTLVQWLLSDLPLPDALAPVAGPAEKQVAGFQGFLQ